MKLLAKAALSALMLAGAATLTAAPAEARVSVGLEFGGGGYGGRPAFCNPYSRYFDRYRCDAYYNDYNDDYDYYNGPVFIDGIWLNDSFRSRYYGGHRQFYYGGSWRGGSGFHDGGFGHGGGGGGHGGGSWGGGGHGGGGGHHHH